MLNYQRVAFSVGNSSCFMHGVKSGIQLHQLSGSPVLSELSRSSFPWEVLATSKWTFHQIQTCKYYIYTYIYAVIGCWFHPVPQDIFFSTHRSPSPYLGPAQLHHTCTSEMLHNVAVEIWQGEPLDFLRAIRICGRIPSAQGAREIPKGPMDTGHLNQAATLEFHCTYTDTVM